MRIFSCSNCSNTVFFENVRCIHCGHTLAYFPEHGMVTSIKPLPAPSSPDQPQLYESESKRIEGQYRLCANSTAYGVCNSAVPADDPEPLCEACRLNDIIPDLSDPAALAGWQSLERAKRRLLFSLKELNLPIESRNERPENGLQFSFMKDGPDGNKVFTGHTDGLITINIAEADDPLREKLRKQLGENYRTVLGHFRHEIGHYYWDRLVRDTEWLPACRALFGDESVSYADSVKRHYDQGPPVDWPQHFVSSYATMHPWEDWAETWAHYMHLVDTIETAETYGLVLRPKPVDGKSDKVVAVRAMDFSDFDELLDAWVPLTVALNSLNRSMGIIDPYPFVLVDDVIAKLRFVHDLVHNWNAEEKVKAGVISKWQERLEAKAKAQPGALSEVTQPSPTVPSSAEQPERLQPTPVQAGT